MKINKFLVLGLPNSGKSSIINCLTESTPIISDVAGTTVDFINYPLLKIPNTFIVDTAGYTKNFVLKNKDKIQMYDNFIFVVDGANPITNEHQIFLDQLRKYFPQQLQNSLLIINKIDKLKKTSVDYDILNVYNFENILEMSAINKSGVLGLINYIKNKISIKEENDDEIPEIIKPKIAILGKTNVGKSTLMNLLAQDNISVVQDSINTTVDPISHDIVLNKKLITLQDTAGFSTEQKIRYDGMVFKRTMEILKESNIVIIMTDHERGITNTDMNLMGLCKRLHKAFIVVINKWDQDKDHVGQYLNGKFFNHELLKVEAISCKTGYGIHHLKKNINEIIHFFNYKIETRELNNWVQKYLNYQNLSLKIKYITQIKSFPPTFAVNMNFKNIKFMMLLQKHLKQHFYKNNNIPIVLKLIR